jgi:putative phage-type endonuclease
MEQLSEEWFAARCGKVTASRMGDLMASTKSGYGAGRGNYMAELIAERLTGKPAERFQNEVMKWGVEKEAEANAAYVFFKDVQIESVGFIVHPTIADSGASPDGYVAADGMVEIKCPLTATHIETLLSSTIASKYIFQMQWQMACTGRQWCDFVSFDPRMPPSMQLFCKRIERDAKQIETLEREVRLFKKELSEKLYALQSRYEAATA